MGTRKGAKPESEPEKIQKAVCYLCGGRLYGALRTWVPDKCNPQCDTYQDICFACLDRKLAGEPLLTPADEKTGEAQLALAL